MNFPKVLLFITFSFVFLFSAFAAKAQTSQPAKSNIDEAKIRNWEYCVIYRQFNGQTKDKKITGIVTVTYLEVTGERNENIEVELVPQNSQDTSTYHLSVTRAVKESV